MAAFAASCALPLGGIRGGRRETRAMWVWMSAGLLADAARQAELFAFSGAHGIGTLWVQVTTGTRGGARAGGLEVTRRDAWQAFLAAAHARGLTVEALDGDPAYAQRAAHDVALAIADAVIAFNRESPREARFDGLHFDIEPYLLPAWRDPASRERLLVDFLTLADAVQRRVREAPGLRFGLDVPFWWHAIDARSGEAIAAVTYGGIRQSASLHAVERLDTVALMDYRNDAEGPDGLVAHASLLLLDAARARGARVYIGVETSPVANPEAGIAGVELPKVTFASRPAAMEPELAVAARVFRQFPAYAGIAVHHYDAYRELTRR